MQNLSLHTNRSDSDAFKNMKVTFDKSLIRSKIKPFTFKKARRVKGPIYDALVSELYEEGCSVAAHYLQCLASKEIGFKNKRIIRDQVCDETELLYALFENIKEAEMKSKENSCSGLRDTLKLLLDCVELLEPFRWKFDWLLKDTHKILTHIADSMKTPGEGTYEMMAQIYYKHGCYLNLTAEDMSLVIHYLEKALELTRGHIWPADKAQALVWGDYKTLHQTVASNLTNALIKYGNLQLHKRPRYAIELAHKAILIQAEVGVAQNIISFCHAHIVKAKFLIENDQYLVALKLLQKVANDIRSKENMDAVKLSCKCFLYQGVCYTNLNDLVSARKYNRLALVMSRKYNLKRTEADALLCLGKLFSLDPGETENAENAFMKAKEIYVELGDQRRKTKILYLLAKLKADIMFPALLNLIREMKDHKCNMYHLRQWKNRCKPFWNMISQNQLNEDMDEIYCVRFKTFGACDHSNPIKNA